MFKLRNYRKITSFQAIGLSSCCRKVRIEDELYRGEKFKKII
jgi:hypothetical protein